MSTDNTRPQPDQPLVDLADYVSNYRIENPNAYRLARYCTIDAIGGALEALRFPDCTRLLGPMVPGTTFANGIKVPGTSLQLDPVSAAFNISTMVRWLDFNDSLSTDQGGHPSDNLGGILAAAAYASRLRAADSKPPLLMRDVLTAVIKSYEIQGVLSMGNNFVRKGYDFVILPKVALTAVATQMLGGTHEQIVNAVSNAWADGVSLTIYRQGSNTGPRMCWAGGDAAARALQLSLMALKGDVGYPSVLTARTYGFHDAFFQGAPFKYLRPYGEYVVDHLILFKFIPASVQAQSAGECAMRLHPLVKDRLDEIDTILVRSHERMMRGLNKTGPLNNAADRSHCIQYVIAVLLIQGRMGTSDFEDEFAADSRIDLLREKMTVIEEPNYTRDFNDPAKRSNTQTIEVTFKDATRLPAVTIEYPSGYPPVGAEGLARVEEKFRGFLARTYASDKQQAILGLCLDQARFEATTVDGFLDMLAA